MDIEFLAITFDFVGKILVAIMALLVHFKEKKERKINIIVIKEIYLEEVLGGLGIIFITLGYILKVFYI